VRLKKSYSAREVVGITGLTARQLQWWDAHRLVAAAVPAHRTAAGGYTERRYSPLDLLELAALADLRRRGFTPHEIRALIETLRERFGIRLFEAISGAGRVQILTDGRELYARTETGQFFNLLREPTQPLLVIGEEGALRELGTRLGARRKKGAQRPKKRAKSSPRG
jgi:DNA-binding transcriptional MerR regulator